MYNSNYQKYHQLVNFGFIGTGINTVSTLLGRGTPLVKTASVAGALGATALGYNAIKDDQARNQHVFNRALDAKNPDEREQLKAEYDANNNAFTSDTKRNGGFALGGLLGAGSVIAPTVGYNLIKGNKWSKYIVR